MTHQFRGRQRWQAGACCALVATLATVAGALATTIAPALADPSGAAGSAATTTSTTVAAAATTTSTIPANVDPAGRTGWVKANAARLIANRVASLNAAINVVQSLSFLGPDGTTLVTNMQTDVSGLQALGTTIAGDPTVQQAIQDRKEIFTQFRVYLLVLPVARDVAAADRVNNLLLPAVQKAVTQLQGQETSSNQDVLGPLVTDMQTQAQVASAATSGLPAQLLAYTPSQWDANHQLLSSTRTDIRTADRALSTAGREFKRAERYLHRTASQAS
jgi:hypothetical protein